MNFKVNLHSEFNHVFYRTGAPRRYMKGRRKKFHKDFYFPPAGMQDLWGVMSLPGLFS
ncbi:hypothetical protein SAMN06265218_11434 [Fodinibius sediminis]|uniref:Uncharacterized protein n=1 Tax=Fodinibius sediminis TaxID=1214077 RepID=A0A521EAW3_9BACT|nr:hypothetical protein SAMN06265218_11434 [Fodinibius sediminis]